ncbi:MAG: ABC transporter substrate-binding protein, partial [Acidimicrobiia bacterium]
MRTGRARWKLLGAILALSLLAAACGGDDDATGDDDDTAAADIDPNGILRLGRDLTVPTAGQLDPISVDIVLDTLHEHLFGTMLHLNADGEVEPDLAESVVIDDPTHLTVTLRPGLKFTDGTVLDAEALKFSWERTIAQARPGGIEAEFREVKTLTVSSPTVLKVELKSPIAGAFYRLMRLGESSPVSPTAVKGGVDLNKTPVGAGPMKLAELKLGESLKLVKNPDYWNADAIKIAGITYTSVTPQSAVNAIKSNTVDYAQVSTTTAREAAGTPGFKFTVEPTSGVMLQGLWCKSRPPFDNLKVRQALNYAIDKESLNIAVYDGKGESMDGFNSSDSPFYNKDLKGYYDHDADKAKKLLAEAGVPNLAFDMFFQPGSEGQQAAEVIQQQLDDIGVKVTLKPLSNAQDFYPN